MDFDSYQSSLLRFAIGQYRRGIGRHRRALSRTHSSVKLRAELGAGLVVLPVYGAARAALLAGRKLRGAIRGAIPGRQSPKLSSKAREMLNLSGFGLSDEVDLGEEIGDSVCHSARPLLQTILILGASLSKFQMEDLSKRNQRTEPKSSSEREFENVELSITRRFGAQSMALVAQWRAAARKLLDFESESIDDGLGLGTSAILSPRQITGVASDLKTRSLVIILDYKIVWNSLNPSQQLRLQRQIALLMNEPAITIASAIMQSPVNALASWIKKGKTIVRSLLRNAIWDKARLSEDANESPGAIAPSKALLWLSSHQSLETHSVSCSSLALYEADASTVLVSKHAKLAEGNCQLATARLSNLVPALSDELAFRSLESLDRDVIEADVISALYIEHPLEKLLKWVDRFLLWIEKWWQRLRWVVARRTPQ